MKDKTKFCIPISDEIVNDINFADVEFVRSFSKAPLRLPLFQFAFAGRSNVGKSSLINTILERKIAKTSKKPGKTRLINVYKIGNICYLVDLPGYGYANISKKIQNEWKELVEDYLKFSNLLKKVFILVDMRRDIQSQEENLFFWLNYHHISFDIILTKCDKLNRKEYLRQLKKFGSLNIPFFITSSKTKQGIKELKNYIEKLVFN
ncbi:MAG: ribosome biogenesis GTP-binding protein YihA/YsxC [Campylobacterota bacterium]|nr:ribosome biogenesis GTP-binding protein YihA/YsxC [Campylobacterota bacterium]